MNLEGFRGWARVGYFAGSPERMYHVFAICCPLSYENDECITVFDALCSHGGPHSLTIIFSRNPKTPTINNFSVERVDCR